MKETFFLLDFWLFSFRLFSFTLFFRCIILYFVLIKKRVLKSKEPYVFEFINFTNENNIFSTNLTWCGDYKYKIEYKNFIQLSNFLGTIALNNPPHCSYNQSRLVIRIGFNHATKFISQIVFKHIIVLIWRRVHSKHYFIHFYRPVTFI